MTTTEASSTPLKVLYQDEHLLVVDKPSGMLVHRGWGQSDVVLVDLVRHLLQVGKVHPIHRIDRGASGLVLFAKDAETARWLNDRFDKNQVDKHYLALVRGQPPECGRIDHPIPRRKGGPRVAAISEFTRLETMELQPRSVSLMEVRPKTGRLHQVRRHLKHINHPLIGDANYGKGSLNRALADSYGLTRLALHATWLSFTHPHTQEAIEIQAPLPQDLSGPLKRMGFGLAHPSLVI